MEALILLNHYLKCASDQQIKTCDMQAAANNYVYSTTRFDATTEKQEVYKAWELPKRPAPLAPPLRPTLPFEGVPAALFTNEPHRMTRKMFL